VKLRFTPQARADLEAYIERVALDNAAAARAERIRITEALALISERPTLGRVEHLKGMRRPARGWPVPPLRIFYEVREAEIVVLTVRHGARRSITR
jgi:plasmid stabilization system protein ParE